jgi:hypothetical protein
MAAIRATSSCTYCKSEPNSATVPARHPGRRRHRGAADRDASKLQWTGAGQALRKEQHLPRAGTTSAAHQKVKLNRISPFHRFGVLMKCPSTGHLTRESPIRA